MSLGRIAGVVLGIGFLMVAAVGIAAHYNRSASTVVTLIASFTPFFVVMAAVVTVAMLISRHWLLAVAGVLLVAVGGWTQLPLYRGATAAPGGVSIRLMSANLLFGRADASVLARTVRADRIDVLTLLELTPSAVSRLESAGLTKELPYSYTAARSGGGGSGIYSRFPLRDGQRLDGFALNNLRAVMQLPDAPAVSVFALHPIPPYPRPARQWAADLRRLRPLLSAATRPVIVGADFNSTYDHALFRDLLADSGPDGSAPLADAAVATGSGIVATWPADRRYPAVIAIDHILAAGATPVSFRRVDVPGSDHHGVIADIRVS